MKSGPRLILYLLQHLMPMLLLLLAMSMSHFHLLPKITSKKLHH